MPVLLTTSLGDKQEEVINVAKIAAERLEVSQEQAILLCPGN